MLGFVLHLEAILDVQEVPRSQSTAWNLQEYFGKQIINCLYQNNVIAPEYWMAF